jgi:hypothetical protein
MIPVNGGESDWTKAKQAGVEGAVAAAGIGGTPARVSWFEGDHDIHAQHPAELTEAILAADHDGLFSGAVPA